MMLLVMEEYSALSALVLFFSYGKALCVYHVCRRIHAQRGDASLGEIAGIW